VVIVTAGTEQLDVGPRGHVVQFYDDDGELTERVGGYLREAVLDGGVAVVIATAAHRAAFEARLADAGVDVAAAVERGAYLGFDAQEMLSGFMIDGQPDSAGFEAVVGSLIAGAVRSGAPVRAYGEMVALLWDDGLVGAAIELEALWNELSCRYPFSLFCGYPAQSVAGNGHFDAFNEVCLLHAGIVDAASAGAHTRAFPLSPSAPAEARHFAVDVIRRMGAAHLAGDVALVATELAANALVHARSAFTIALSSGDEVVRISVRDESGLPESGLPGSGLPGSGLPAAPLHGLGVVATLARRWGVVPFGDHGKAVWAELPR
jgi:MEDS: MEthanogen/methylotroph, DcmR Sensory domain